MAEETLSYAELIQILQLIKNAPQFGEFQLKLGEVEIDVSRGTSDSEIKPTLPSGAASALHVAESKVTLQGPPATPPQPVNTPEPAQQTSGKTVFVRSPMVGTFYRAPTPGAPPFIDVGQTVEPDTTICIIKVMKLRSSIVAGTRGTVTQILAKNAEMVEYDQVLVAIEPR